MSFSDGVNQWPVLTGETTDAPRTSLPIHMDYVTGTGGIIITVDGTYYKYFASSCYTWYDYKSGNSTVLGYDSSEGEELVVSDLDASTFCDDGDTDYYRLYVGMRVERAPPPHPPLASSKRPEARLFTSSSSSPPTLRSTSHTHDPHP